MQYPKENSEEYFDILIKFIDWITDPNIKKTIRSRLHEEDGVDISCNVSKNGKLVILYTPGGMNSYRELMYYYCKKFTKNAQLSYRRLFKLFKVSIPVHTTMYKISDDARNKGSVENVSWIKNYRVPSNVGPKLNEDNVVLSNEVYKLNFDYGFLSCHKFLYEDILDDIEAHSRADSIKIARDPSKDYLIKNNDVGPEDETSKIIYSVMEKIDYSNEEPEPEFNFNNIKNFYLKYKDIIIRYLDSIIYIEERFVSQLALYAQYKKRLGNKMHRVQFMKAGFNSGAEVERFILIIDKIRNYLPVIDTNVTNSIADLCRDKNLYLLVRNLSSNKNWNKNNELETLTKAIIYRWFSVKRYGKIERLRQALKGWTLFNGVPMSVAVRLSKLNTRSKFIAKIIFESYSKIERANLKRYSSAVIKFWETVAKVSSMREREAIKSLVSPNISQYVAKRIYSRIITSLFKNFDIEDQKKLYKCALESSIHPCVFMDIDPKVFVKLDDQEIPQEIMQFAIEHYQVMLYCVLFRLNSLERLFKLIPKLRKVLSFSHTTNLVSMLIRKFSMPTESIIGFDEFYLRELGNFCKNPPTDTAYAFGKLTDEMSTILVSWPKLSEEDKKSSRRELIKKIKYLELDVMTSEIAEEVVKHSGIAPEHATRAELVYLSSQSIPEPIDTSLRWSHNGLTAKFLTRRDTRGMYLGKYTGCCQFPGGGGSTSAAVGQGFSNSGFLTIEDSNNNIIAQSWFWIDLTTYSLVFDNIEAAHGIDVNTTYASDVAKLYDEVSEYLSKQGFNVSYGLGHDKLGANHVLPYWSEKLEASDPRFVKIPSWCDYTDAKNQQIIIRKAEFTKQKSRVILADYHYMKHRYDSSILLPVLVACYPTEDPQSILPEEDSGLVLMEDNGPNKPTIIGYTTWNEKEKEITDLAVLPAQRSKYSAVLLRALLKHVCLMGGEWSMDCRESTSYPLIKHANKKNLIDMTIIGDSGYTIENEKMIKVVISCKHPENKLTMIQKNPRKLRETIADIGLEAHLLDLANEFGFLDYLI